jgi:type I restriction enzyme S subunit
MSNFLVKPKSIKKSDIINKVFSFHPTEHKKIDILNNNLKPISKLIVEEGVGEQIDVEEYLNFNSNYTLVTISNMGKCIINVNQGESISPNIFNKSTKKLKKGDVLISRNASLGKITLINKEFNSILNGGISFLRLKEESKFYTFAFFLLDYGTDYLTVLTSGGGTQKNAKRQNLLDLKIPFPTLKNNKNPKLIEEYISLLTQNIINKEEQIETKQIEIDNIVYNELKINQKSSFKFSLPKKSDLLKFSRIDTGLYIEKYKEENHLIENYKNGFFKIESSKFKSGSTPKVRVFNPSNSIFKWVTPTNISDEGFYNPTEKISMPTDNNLKKDCILFINRTSKGKKGEYVGVTCFYDTEYYGKGHHNQGLYRIEHLPKMEMLYITAFMNSRVMRKICGNISIGSKMKEMKSYDFATLKFPKFNEDLKEKIATHYYNKIEKEKFNFVTYLEKEKDRNSKLGIFQLNAEIIEIKNELDILINKIIKEEMISISE